MNGAALRWGLRLVRLGLVVALLGWIAASGRVTVDGVLAVVTRPLTLAVVALQVLILLLNLTRWVALARDAVPQLSWGRGFQVAARAHFTTLVIPAVGGSDALKVALLRDLPASPLAASCLADRVYALLGLGLVLALSMVGALWLLGPASAVTKVFPGAALFVVAIAAFVPALRVTRHVLAGRTHPWLLALARVAEQTTAALRWSPRALGFLAMSALSHLCVALSVALAGALAVAPIAFVVTPLVTLASALPLTPQGLGVSETVIEFLYRLVGVSGGATALLSVRVAALVATMLAGTAWLVGASKAAPPPP